MESGRNRPGRLENDAAVEAAGERPEALTLHERLSAGVATYGKPPSEIAEHVLGAIREERFYILPHTEFDGLVRERMEKILERTHPQVRRF